MCTHQKLNCQHAAHKRLNGSTVHILLAMSSHLPSDFLHKPQDSMFNSYFANILMIIFLEHTHLKISVYLKLQLELNKCL